MLKKLICFLVFMSAISINSILYSEAKGEPEIKSVREDIQIINLLNNMNLRKEQIKFIIEKAKEADTIRSERDKQIESDKEQMLSALNAIKQKVESGLVTVEKEEAIKFRELNEKTEIIDGQTKERIDVIAEAVKSNLEEFQLIAVDSYKPCIVPIISQGRIGQTDAGQGFIKILEQVKSIPDERYTERKEKLVDRVVAQVKQKSNYVTKIDESKLRVQISDYFEEIRKITPSDFLAKKESIAEDFAHKVIPKKPSPNRLDKIRRFLLSRNIIPILEKKLD